MKLIKVIVDEIPAECVQCPLNRTYTRDCGRMSSRNCNGGTVFGKMPDRSCKLTERDESQI